MKLHLLPQGRRGRWWALRRRQAIARPALFRCVQEGAVLLERDVPHRRADGAGPLPFRRCGSLKRASATNIRAARPDATEAEILHAAQLAQCSDILEKTPGGLDPDRRQGVYLSGGEMQRIALAERLKPHRGAG